MPSALCGMPSGAACVPFSLAGSPFRYHMNPFTTIHLAFSWFYYPYAFKRLEITTVPEGLLCGLHTFRLLGISSSLKFSSLNLQATSHFSISQY